MATRFNQNILDAARRLKDARTDATSAGDAGMRYSSDLMVTYENRAIMDVVKDVFAKYGREGFSTVMSEMTKPSTALTSFTTPGGQSNGVFQKPGDAWTFIEVIDASNNQVVKRIDVDLLKVLNGLDPLTQPSISNAVYYESGVNIVAVPSPSVIVGRYIIVHPVMDTGSTTDILISPYFDGEIVDRMIQAALSDTYKEAPKQ